MTQAMEGGARFIYDGLHGVGAATMRYFLDKMFGQGKWEDSIVLINDEPRPDFGGKFPPGVSPDPSDPRTLELSGVLDRLAADPSISATSTADMDADRIGPAVRIPEEQIPRAARFGLKVNKEGAAGVPIVRFTPQQIFALISWNRILDAFEDLIGTRDLKAIRMAIKRDGVDPTNIHVFTTMPTSNIIREVADYFGCTVHLTGVGFKYLGAEAYEVDDQARKAGVDAVVIGLFEESGGGIIGPGPSELDIKEFGFSSGRDKCTTALTLAIFDIAGQLMLEGMTMVDQYIEMAEKMGGLYYFTRLDMYLPDQDTARSKEPAQVAACTAMKEQMLASATALLDDTATLAALIRDGLAAAGYGMPGEVAAVEEMEFEGTNVLQQDESGAWVKKPIVGRRLRFANGSSVEAGFLKEAVGGGPLFVMRDANGRFIGRILMRPSGTESLIRAYMEVLEPMSDPQPENLYRLFMPMLEHVGAAQYNYTDGDTLVPYPMALVRRVNEEYVRPLRASGPQAEPRAVAGDNAAVDDAL